MQLLEYAKSGANSNSLRYVFDKRMKPEHIPWIKDAFISAIKNADPEVTKMLKRNLNLTTENQYKQFLTNISTNIKSVIRLRDDIL